MRLSPLLIGPRARLRRLAATVGAPTTSPLRGRTVLVTGASSGIGRATAVAVARRGAHVILVARREPELQQVAEAIRAEGGTAEVHALDLTDGTAVDALAATVLAEHGAVDHLVNNAGRSIRRSLSLSVDRFHDVERTMAINFFAPVRLTMALLPAMRAQGFGHVVNVVTWGVQLKAPKFSAYVASKTALDSWARVAGRETWDDGVTFTNMRFGLVHTPMVVPSSSAMEQMRGTSPEQAGEDVVRALEDRPLTTGNMPAAIGELANILLPRLADAFFAWVHVRYPDTAAARGRQRTG